MNTTIEFYILQLVYVPNFSLNWQYWFFGPNLSKKGYFRSKTEKLDISRDTTCQLKLTILIFLRPNLPKKGISGWKHKKWTSPWDFSSNWQFWVFGPNLHRKFSVENRKIVLLLASVIVTYYMQYIKLNRMGADRHNSIWLSLLRLVAETNKTEISPYYLRPQNKNWNVMGPLS